MVLLLQLVVILTLSRVMRLLIAPLGQPAVIGEMIAGLMLGPSFFGWLLPQWSAALFPPASLDALNAVSQVGLVLFMFLVGLRVRRHSAGSIRAVAMTTSAVSIVVPFALGALFAVTVHDRLAPDGVARLPFALFVGAAMSITAFPVLARILTEHALLMTDVGITAISCAAFDDVSGWLIVAAILSFVRGEQAQSFVAEMLLFVAYLAAMLFIVRPALTRAAARWTTRGEIFATGLLAALLSAVATDALGVHALFGAFFAGLMMPRDASLETVFVDRLEPVTATLLLPLFFAFTGLRTSLQLIDSGVLATVTLTALAVATIGKGGASALAARAMGMQWREASTLGVLLNTRGLIELVILNIGLEAGILSPLAFSMLVVMALVTTFVTSPALRVLMPREAEREDRAEAAVQMVSGVGPGVGPR